MLLLDDDDELPVTPHAEETALAERLGVEGLRAIDTALLEFTGTVQRKVAAIVARALDAGGFPASDEYVDLHVRRLIGLVQAGKLVVFGDPRKPRWSEARVSGAP